MVNLVQKEVINQYEKASKGGPKRYPSLELVRLEQWFFNSKRSGKLLEYGFGGGCNTAHLYECGYNIYGLDVTKGSIRNTKERFKKIKKRKGRTLSLNLLKANSKTIPFKNNYFDYIVAMSVLSLLGSKTKILHLLKEFKRILKKDGKIILDMNDHKSEFSKGNKMVKKNVFLTNSVDKKIYTYCMKSSNEFADLVSKCFEINDIGYSSHKVFGRRINEWIVCATNNK